MPKTPLFPAPIATVDAVLLTLSRGALSVGLVERNQEPFAGVLAFLGGYVHVLEDSTLEAAATRILKEKTRVECRFLEQLDTFSGATRDPRGWSLTVAYFALMPEAELLAAESALSLHPVEHLPQLTFDHAAIVAAAVMRLRGKSSTRRYRPFYCRNAEVPPDRSPSPVAQQGGQANSDDQHTHRRDIGREPSQRDHVVVAAGDAGRKTQAKFAH